MDMVGFSVLNLNRASRRPGSAGHAGAVRRGGWRLPWAPFVVVAVVRWGAPPLAAASPAAPKPRADDVIELAAVEVTGSIIRRAEVEGPAPVKVITRAEIEQSGRASVSEYLQQLPEAGYSENNENAPALGTSYRGLSALNLRGFDPTNTLVLVDGRRAVLSGIGWNGTMFADLNRFPAAMVERIEILQDSGTLYGSGSIGGVVNIILRRDYTGTEFTARYANSLRTDVGERSFSLLTGVGKGRTNVTVGLSHSAQNSLRAADTTFAGTVDLTARFASKGAAYAARAAAGTFDFRSNLSPQARISVAAGQRNGVNGVDIPGLAPGAVIVRLPGTGGQAGGTLSQATPNFANPAVSGTGGQFNAAAAASFVEPVLARNVAPSNYYNGNELFWLTPRKERTGVDVSLRHALSTRVAAYARANYQHNWSHIERDPVAVSGQIVPRTNYWNPFGIDVVINWRPVELGPSTSSVVDETTTALCGLRGRLAGTWQWDTAVSYGFDRNTEVYGNYLSRQAWEAGVARNTPEALNVFGGAGYRNPPEIINALRANWDLQGKSRVYAWDARISGDLFSLPTGPVGAGVLTEARREKFGDYRRTVDERATLLNPPFDWSDPAGTRTVWSAAAELHVPLVRTDRYRFLHAADLSANGRYDCYGEGYDPGLKPYCGVRVQPDRWLTLRASLARTFRAPTLPYLYGRASDQSYTWTDLRRPVLLTGDPVDGPMAPRPARIGGDPDLQPCHSRTWQYGFVADVPGRWLKGLTLGVTYSHLEETGTFFHLLSNPNFILFNEVNGGTAAYLVREPGTETYTNRTATPIPILSGPGGEMTAVAPGATVSVPGRISYLRLLPINLSRQRAENCDFSLIYSRPLGTFGTLRLQSAASYARFRGVGTLPSVPLANTIGREPYPRVRLQSSLAWRRLDWSAALSSQYIGPYGDLNRGAGVEVASSSTLGAQVRREFPRGAKHRLAGVGITLGVDNLLDRDPPLAYHRTGYHAGNALRPAGRVVYAQLKRSY